MKSIVSIIYFALLIGGCKSDGLKAPSIPQSGDVRATSTSQPFTPTPERYEGSPTVSPTVTINPSQSVTPVVSNTAVATTQPTTGVVSTATSTSTPSNATPVPTAVINNNPGTITNTIQVNVSSGGVSGSYVISIPSNLSSDNPYGLLVHVPGVSGDSIDPGPIGIKHRLMGVKVNAPSGTTGLSTAAHAGYLQAIINDVKSKHPVRNNQIYFSGLSGGSHFLTQHFFPLQGNNYSGGGVVLLCGGLSPASALSPVATFSSTFRMTWYMDRNDGTPQVSDFVNAMIAAENAYKAKGFMTSSSQSTINGHCQFPEGFNGALAAKILLVLH